MSKKRKRKQAKAHDNVKIVTPVPHVDDLGLEFSFIETTPFEITLDKLAVMPFKKLDENFEKYGIARCFSFSEGVKETLLTCFFRSKTVITPSPTTLEWVGNMILEDLKHAPGTEGRGAGEQLMTLFGSIFLMTIGVSTNRMREYQIYMNSVCPMQLPVPDENCGAAVSRQQSVNL